NFRLVDRCSSFPALADALPGETELRAERQPLVLVGDAAAEEEPVAAFLALRVRKLGSAQAVDDSRPVSSLGAVHQTTTQPGGAVLEAAGGRLNGEYRDHGAIVADVGEVASSEHHVVHAGGVGVALDRQRGGQGPSFADAESARQDANVAALQR